MTITLNNYSDAEYIEVVNRLGGFERITLHRGDNAKGSNEKLKHLAEGQAPYCMLMDDDIIYAEDYLKKLIHGCEKYQAMVSLHGVIIADGLIRSYYRDRVVFRGLKTVTNDQEVDIASNCGSLWKRQWFSNYEDWYDRCGNVSCDDIYVAIFMKEKGIPRYVLAHEEGYITHKVQYKEDDYVFDKHALVPNGDVFQTVLINSFYKKL